MVNKSNYVDTHIFLSAFFLSVLLIAPVFTFGQKISPGPLNLPLNQNDQNIGKAGVRLDRLISSITRVVNWFSWFSAVVAVAMGLYAAFLYLTARGDAKQGGDAHQTLVYA